MANRIAIKAQVNSRLILFCTSLIFGLQGPIFATCSNSTPPTYTTKAGLAKPAINSCNWGLATNADWDIVDSSAAFLNYQNVFLTTQTVQGGPLSIKGQPVRYFDNSTHYIELQASSTVTTTHFTLPVADGLSGQFLKTDGVGGMAFATVPGSVAPALGVNQNGVSISTPTNQINFIGPPFSVTLAGASTAQVTLNSSSVTLQGNSFNGASQLVKLDGSSKLPVVDGSNLTNVKITGVLPGGSTSYWNYPSSGTFFDTQGIVTSTLTATVITASGLSAGQCVQTTTGGQLTTTGAACGSGGGGGGSSGYAVQPATVTFQLNLGLSASTATVSTMTITGYQNVSNGKQLYFNTATGGSQSGGFIYNPYAGNTSQISVIAPAGVSVNESVANNGFDLTVPSFKTDYGINSGTITTTGDITVGSGAGLYLDYPSFPVSSKSRIHWTSFGAENGSIGIGDSSPQGLGMYDGSGNLIAQEISSDSYGTTIKGFTIRNGGALRFYDSASNSGIHFISFKASGTVTANHEYTLPATGGGEGQVFTLHADSSTYWSTPSAGGGSPQITNVNGTAPIIASVSGTTTTVSLSQTIGQAETFTSSTTHTAVIQSTGIYVSSATVGFDTYVDSNSSTAQTINWTQGNYHYSRLTGNVTYTFIPPYHTATFHLNLDSGNGGFTVTWPASVHWGTAGAPTLTATANKIDIIACEWLEEKSYFACQAAAGASGGF
jgi:hypothetical protein